MVTICESSEGTGYDDGDVLVFPHMIKYKRLKDSDIGEFIDDVLVKGVPWASGVQEKLTGSHIFGVKARGLQDQVHVIGCSEVTAPQYAPNLILYRSDSEGRVSGHWYGHVTPADASDLLVWHIGKGVAMEHKLRGQVGKYDYADEVLVHKS